jgi:hypothetical protein
MTQKSIPTMSYASSIRKTPARLKHVVFGLVLGHGIIVALWVILVEGVTQGVERPRGTLSDLVQAAFYWARDSASGWALLACAPLGALGTFPCKHEWSGQILWLHSYVLYGIALTAIDVLACWLLQSNSPITVQSGSLISQHGFRLDLEFFVIAILKTLPSWMLLPPCLMTTIRLCRKRRKGIGPTNA